MSQSNRTLELEALRGLVSRSAMHELNNQLQPVLGFAAIAARSVEEGSELAGQLEEVVAGARSMKSLLQRAMAYRRTIESDTEAVTLASVAPALRQDEDLLRLFLRKETEFRIEDECSEEGGEHGVSAVRSAVVALMFDLQHVFAEISIAAFTLSLKHGYEKASDTLRVSLAYQISNSVSVAESLEQHLAEAALSGEGLAIQLLDRLGVRRSVSVSETGLAEIVLEFPLHD